MNQALEAAVLSGDTDDVSEAVDIDALDVSSANARTERMAKAVLFALGLAVVLIAVAAPGLGETSAATDGPRLGGDLPAFYAAGSIVLDGDIGQLYDASRQQAAQDELGIDGYLAFAYPPHVAVAYAPLSALDFRIAYVVHTFAMAGAFVFALRLLADVVPAIRRWRWQLAAGGLTFVPLITSVGGGQNASLTVLGLAVVWWALARDREVLAGVAAGLLAFRPQYALPLIGLLLLARHWRAVAAAVGVIAATWVAAAALLGPMWLTTWMDQVVPFVEADAGVNAANSISLLGALQAVTSAESMVALVLGVLGAVVVIATLAYLWMYPRRFTLAWRMGAMAIGMLLISPHTMFYDAALLTIAGAAVIATRTAGAPRVLIFVWLAALSHVFNDALGFTPLALVVAASFALAIAAAFASAPPTRPPQWNNAPPPKKASAHA